MRSTQSPSPNQFDRRLDRSIINYDYPHFAKMTWIYELPIGPGKALRVGGVAGRIIGGWQVTANHQIRSGSPLSIRTGGINNPTGAVARPDYVSGQSIISNADAGINFRGFAGGTAYLNRAAFANPPVFAGGQNVVQRLGRWDHICPHSRPVFHLGEHRHREGFQVQ